MNMEQQVKDYMAAYPYATFVYQELCKVFKVRYDYMLVVLRRLQQEKKIANFKNARGEVRWHIMR